MQCRISGVDHDAWLPCFGLNDGINLSQKFSIVILSIAKPVSMSLVSIEIVDKTSQSDWLYLHVRSHNS
jgi:hypothetical protein